jgi:hypothetical protein
MDLSDEFLAGYLDGRDLDSPKPSANRSHCYRHSWAVGRNEVLGEEPIPAWRAREMARRAERLDLETEHGNG